MILAATISSIVQYLNSDNILYGYDYSGLYLRMSKNDIIYTPSAQVQPATSIVGVSAPTYAEFITSTENSKFITVSEPMYGTMRLNTARVESLEELDTNLTKIWFDKKNYVITDTPVATLLSAINVALRGELQGDEDFVSDGTGVITLAHDYIPDSWTVTLRGVEVRKTDVNETGANELTLLVTTEIDDFINVKYKY